MKHAVHLALFAGAGAGALAATVLAGAVELTLGRGLDVEQAVRIRDQWREGKMDVSSLNWLVLWPQHINANPAVVTDPQFRRARCTPQIASNSWTT